MPLIPFRPRCLAYMFICDEDEMIINHLRFREELGIDRKTSKYIFLTTSTKIKAEVFAMEEFQYHGHAGRQIKETFSLISLTNVSLISVLFHFDRFNCLDRNISLTESSKCALFAYHYDTFGTFRPKMFNVFPVSNQV